MNANTMTTLSELPRGIMARVKDLCTENTVAQRLMTLGLLPGIDIQVVEVAPFGDPIAVEFNGQRISLRLTEAAGVLIDRR